MHKHNSRPTALLPLGPRRAPDGRHNEQMCTRRAPDGRHSEQMGARRAPDGRYNVANGYPTDAIMSKCVLPISRKYQQITSQFPDFKNTFRRSIFCIFWNDMWLNKWKQLDPNIPRLPHGLALSDSQSMSGSLKTQPKDPTTLINAICKKNTSCWNV